MSDKRAPANLPQEKKEEKMDSAGTKKEEKIVEEEIDIDLNDPEVGAAAVKIQSAFKNRKGFGKK